MEQAFTLDANGAGVDRAQLGFLARSVLADNPTGQWWQITTDAPHWIAPYTVGITIALPAGTQLAAVYPTTPVGQQSTPIAGQQAVFVFRDADAADAAGLAVIPTQKLSVSANGFVHLDVQPGADGGTIRWRVNGPSAGQVLVIDVAGVWADSAGQVAQVAMWVEKPDYTVIAFLTKAGSPGAQGTSGDHAHGPIYIPPGYNVVAWTYNAGPGTAHLIASVVYHYQVQ